MEILSGLVIVYLCLLSRKIDCGLVGDVFNAFNPLNILDNLDRALSTTTPLVTSTEKTKLITVPETVFHVAPTLQALYEPNNAVAKVNYIVSPLSAVSLLGQVLIGTHGQFHKYVATFLELNLKTKRQVQIFELTKDSLYDEKLYHSAFHWKLMSLLNRIKSNKYSIVTLENALVYNKNAELVKHFKKYIEQYYKTKIFAVNPDEIDKSVLGWIEMNEKRRSPMSPTQETNKAVFGNKLKFVSTWDTPFKDNLVEGPFQINRFEQIKVKYLQATIKNATYLHTNLFTLAVIPLKNREFQLYVMLPTDRDSPIRDFSESVKDFEFFKTMKGHEPVNMELEMPKIFPYVADLDVMQPIHDDFLDRGYNNLKNIALNGAAKNLLLTNSIQHLEISIENESVQLKSAPGIPSAYETQHETLVQPLPRQMVVEQPGWPEGYNEARQKGFVQYEPFGFAQQPYGYMQQPEQSSESVQLVQFMQQPQQPSPSAQQPYQFMKLPSPSTRQPSQFMQQPSPSAQQSSQFMQLPQQPSPSTQQSSQFMQQAEQPSQSAQQPSQFMQQTEQPFPYAQQPSQFMQQAEQPSPSTQQPSQFMQQPQQPSATYGMSGMRTVQFKVNCPFLFLIMHESTKMTILWGSIADPSKL